MTVGKKNSANELEVRSIAYTANGESKNNIVFTNTYTPPKPGSCTLDGFTVSKRYTDGSDATNAAVSFRLTGSEGAPMPQKSALTINDSGFGCFGDIVFTEAGTYTYTVTEVSGSVEGMTYDQTAYTAAVKVSLNAENKLIAEVAYTAGGENYTYGGDGFVFTNAYHKTPEIVETGALCITKPVSGTGADVNAQFLFRVEVGEINGEYSGVTFQNGSAVIGLKAGESITISGLPAGAAYAVTELNNGDYTVSAVNTEGRVPSDGIAFVSFNNHKDVIIIPDPVIPDPTPDLDTKNHYSYIIGFTDGTVRPEANISRAEVATIFFRMLRDSAREENWCQINSYSDVPADMWCNNAISTLTKMGILSGYPDGTFRSTAPITRSELTKIAVSFFKYADLQGYIYDGRFPDVTGNEWYARYLAAVEFGLIEGDDHGMFRPDDFITRAETCTVVNRTLGRKPHKDCLLPYEMMVTWPDNTNTEIWYYAAIQEATNSHKCVRTMAGQEQFEKWTVKLADRDWAALERIWSNVNSAPGGEVIS